MPQIQFGKILLDDWDSYERIDGKAKPGGWNYYRAVVGDNSSKFGLIIRNSKIFYTNPTNCIWYICGLGQLQYVEDLHIQSNGIRMSYSFGKLEQAKKDIDEFLIKMGRLIIFL